MSPSFSGISFWRLSPALLSKGYDLKKWAGINGFGKFSFILLFLVLFFFFPNTAYLFSDIRHLVDYCQDPGFYRACKDQAYIVPIFFTYSLVGVPTFYYALSKMSYILSKLFGKSTGKLFPVLMSPVTGLGLMLGLVDRFNSWDIVRDPISIVLNALHHLSSPIMLTNILSYSMMMYIIYYFIRAVYKK